MGGLSLFGVSSSASSHASHTYILPLSEILNKKFELQKILGCLTSKEKLLAAFERKQNYNRNHHTLLSRCERPHCHSHPTLTQQESLAEIPHGPRPLDFFSHRRQILPFPVFQGSGGSISLSGSISGYLSFHIPIFQFSYFILSASVFIWKAGLGIKWKAEDVVNAFEHTSYSTIETSHTLFLIKSSYRSSVNMHFKVMPTEAQRLRKVSSAIEPACSTVDRRQKTSRWQPSFWGRHCPC